MKRLCVAMCGLAAAVSSAAAADPTVVAPPEAWSVTFASEARYYSWAGNRGYPTTVNTAPGSGSEVYVPFALQLAGKPAEDFKVQFLVRGGWVRAHQGTPGMTGTVDTATDTVTSGTVTYLGINGVQPFAALNLNLPSGRSALFGSAAFARMDPDLVEIATFGEGFNIGPTAGLNLPITPSLIFTTSVGYTWRGPFDRERSTAEPNPAIQSPTSVNPGNVLTGTASIGYQDNRWAWSLTGTVSEETTTTENGIDLYRAGRRYLGTASASYTWPGQGGQTTLTGSAVHSNHNDVKFLALPALVKELMNTNSNLFRIGAQHLFPVGQTIAVGPTASFLRRDHNGYAPGILQMVPEKDRWALGGLARMAVAQNVTLNVRAERVWTHENERPAPNGLQFSVLANAFVAALPVPVVSSHGWVAAFGADVKF